LNTQTNKTAAANHRPVEQSTGSGNCQLLLQPTGRFPHMGKRAMKPRARRVTIGAVLGAVLVAALVVTHWGTVRDHVEAWHFQEDRNEQLV